MISIIQIYYKKMFTYKDILLFDVYESYGFPVALKVFGFFNAVLKFRPNSKFVIKSDHDIQVDTIQTIIEETRNCPSLLWESLGWRRRMARLRDKKSKHYVSVNAFSLSHYPPFCSGWGYETCKRYKKYAIYLKLHFTLQMKTHG